MDAIIRFGQVGSKRRVALIITAIAVAASTITIAYFVDRAARGVVVTVDTDKDEYHLGEPILLRAHLRNYGFETVELVYGSSVKMTFAIRNSSGFLVFFEPEYHLWVITHVELSPGESRDYGYSWDQINETSAQVKVPDTFTLHAWSGAYGQYLSANTTFSITA